MVKQSKKTAAEAKRSKPTPSERLPWKLAAERLRTFKWPRFIEREAGELLARQVQAVARNEGERRAFLVILNRAFDDVLELRALHRLVPDVLAGGQMARRRFLEVLEGAARLPRSSGSPGRGMPRTIAYRPSPDGWPGLPVSPAVPDLA